MTVSTPGRASRNSEPKKNAPRSINCWSNPVHIRSSSKHSRSSAETWSRFVKQPHKRRLVMSKNPFGNMGNIMKQAQAMQEQLAKIQEQAGAKTVQGTAGGGMVTVTANGAMEVTAVKIDPEVMKSGDVDMLQDLIVAATGEALRNAKDMMANEMKSVTGGMRIPGMF